MFDRFFFSEPLQKRETKASHGDNDKLKVVKLGVQGMNCCASCSANIEAGLRNKLGIIDIKSFSFTEKLVVQFDPVHIDVKDIVEEIARIGFKAEPLSDDTSEGNVVVLLSYVVGWLSCCFLLSSHLRFALLSVLLQVETSSAGVTIADVLAAASTLPGIRHSNSEVRLTDNSIKLRNEPYVLIAARSFLSSSSLLFSSLHFSSLLFSFLPLNSH